MKTGTFYSLSLSDSEAKEKLGKGKRSQRPRSEIDFAPWKWNCNAKE